jgi:hypothetical protein
MTDTALEPRFALNPATGERVELDATNDDLVLALADVKEMGYRLNEHARLLGRELQERMDRAANWTLRAGPFKVTGRSPEPPDEYDGEQLFKVLVGLVHAGTITEEAAEQACKTEHKAKVAGVNKLKKLPGLRDKLEACRVKRDPDEYARSRPAPRVTVADA